MKINRRSFLIQWVTFVTITFSLAMWAAFASIWTVGEIVENALGETATAFVVGGLFGALIAGGASIGQGLVLARQGISPGPWILRTCVAGIIGTAIGMTVAVTFMDMDSMPEAMIGIHFGLSAGVPIGQVQSQLLKEQLNQPRLWILICAIAFALGFAVGLPLSGEGRAWLSIGTIALLVAIISGTGMVWLSRGVDTAVAV